MAVKLKGLLVVAMFLTPGVRVDAGGWAIINGKLVKIPPRGPATRQLMEAIQEIAVSARRR
jgi:hypothetical protein